MAEEQAIEASTGNKIVDLTKKVTLYATKKAPYHKAGEKFECHPNLAEHFVVSGFATEKPNGDTTAEQREIRQESAQEKKASMMEKFFGGDK